jgi:copper homeostasis protein
MKREDFELEICVDSIESVIAAEQGGANRVELCNNLYEGGTTPSVGTLVKAKEKVDIDVFVMIRPRGGDFLYSEDEIQIMLKDIEKARKYGANGIVIGCLNVDGTIHSTHCKRLIESAKGLPITFHRAFDMCNNPFKALEDIQSLGISRILTSGMQNKAIDGIDLLNELINDSENSPKIMVGSGVDENNILEIAQKTNAKAFHATLREEVDSKMQYRKEGIFMGGLPEVSEFSNKFTDANRVKKLIEILSEMY